MLSIKYRYLRWHAIEVDFRGGAIYVFLGNKIMHSDIDVYLIVKIQIDLILSGAPLKTHQHLEQYSAAG